MDPPLASLLWRSFRVYQVFGANTNVGKTIFSTLLARAAKKTWPGEHVAFVKPVSTGAEEEADDRHLARFAPGVERSTLFQYDIPCSPHKAALESGRPIPSDDTLLTQCHAAAQSATRGSGGWLFMETAGGVHSPGPSGKTQADLYMPLRAPTLLVGDARLGGISQTITAFESLHLRGYDVDAVVLFRDNKFENHQFLTKHFEKNHGIPVCSVAEPPTWDEDPRRNEAAMREYYALQDCDKFGSRVLTLLRARHEKRISDLESMAARASRHIWYPFTQQNLVGINDIMAIDSAYGDYFQTLARPVQGRTKRSGRGGKEPSGAVLDKHGEDGGEKDAETETSPMLRASFDGSASWWTQGLGHANPWLAMAAGRAAGRYGHVMFASAIHEPAISLAETLLEALQNPRLTRVFYSDNGSTGAEVAVKMGLRAARLRYGWDKDDKDKDKDARQELHILGLKGAYHGDTMGAMDCADPSIYNEKIEWYAPRGHWLDYPTVLCRDGRWTVSAAGGDGAELAQRLGIPERGRTYGSLNDIFDLEGREAAGEHAAYEKYITRTLEELRAQGRRFGALMLEPVVLGAGGMHLVDPLFQRTLVNTVRRSLHLFGTPTTRATQEDPTSWTGLPVIFDEVFTGLYRLGRLTSSSFLGVQPDISIHAKLLTGGLLPLCTTLASESLFADFLSPDKTDALLHGHSYTAHPVGCQVALESLREMQSMEARGVWGWAREQGWAASVSSSPEGAQDGKKTKHGGRDAVWSTWPRDFVEHLSRLTSRVDGVWALGSVLAIHLRDEAGGGYGSNAAAGLRERLARGKEGPGGVTWNVHSRVLGNVLYLMTSQVTGEEAVRRLCGLVVESLEGM